MNSISKCPRRLAVLLVCALGAGFAVPAAPVEGRIGERRQTIEKRLKNSGGIVYRRSGMVEERKKGMPYMKYMEYLPGSTELRVYYKTADGRNPSSGELIEKGSLPGWDLHVVYVGGRSAIEVYKRSGGMSEYEFNKLLSKLAGDSYWKKVKKDERGSSAFGYTMEREDGTVRAKKSGNDTLMIFSSSIDERLAERNEEELAEQAPVSVEGF